MSETKGCYGLPPTRKGEEARVIKIRSDVNYTPPVECKHDWKKIKGTDYTQDWKCKKCGKYKLF